ITEPVLDAGSDALRKTVLPIFTRDGFAAGSAAVTEPAFNYDVNEMQTTAVRQNGDVVLNGAKCFVPLAADAEHVLVYARGEQGVTGVVVPRDTKGLTIGER